MPSDYFTKRLAKTHIHHRSTGRESSFVCKVAYLADNKRPLHNTLN